jgi:hypothetical protein
MSRGFEGRMRFRLLSLLVACAAAGPALAQPPAPAPATGPSAAHTRVISHPLWRELSPEQHEALAPLASDWDKIEENRKKKWLEIAAKYPNLSAEGKKRVHERMPQLARLTQEQRETTRENFVKAYSLPPGQRQVLTQRYQELPEERKKALAAQAHTKKAPAPPRRPATALHEASSVEPTKR